MKKANVEKLETMAAGYLQYRYKMYLGFGKRDADWVAYSGACDTLEAFGATWWRHYHGGDTEEERDDFKNYHHSVRFPSDEACNRLNVDAWKEQ